MMTKNIVLSLLFLLMIFSVMGQDKGTTHDKVIAHAAALYKSGDYLASLNTLSTISNQGLKGQNIELYFRYSILNRYKIIEAENNSSWDNIEKTKSDLENYQRRVKSPRQDIINIRNDIDQNYPKNKHEFDRLKAEEQKRRIVDRNSQLLRSIQQSYSAGNYKSALTKIEDARKVGYDDHHIAYQEFMSKSMLYTNSIGPTYDQVNELNNVGKKFLNDKSALNEQRKLVQDCVDQLPKSLAEFEKAKQLAQENREGQLRINTLASMKKEYSKGNYDIVLAVTNIFEKDKIKVEEYDYLKVASRYMQLLGKTDRVFSSISVSEIESVRSSLQKYLNTFNSSSENYSKVQQFLTQLNLRYGKNAVDYNRIKNSASAEVAKAKRDAEKARLKTMKRMNRSMFISIGYEYGKMAPYGLRFETGGGFMGMFVVARTGLVSDDDLYNEYYNTGNSKPNKSELIIGPNFRITRGIYLNVGVGYGYYKFMDRNDYQSSIDVNQSNYWAGYSGLTLRLGNTLNINGGASFIDINKQFSDKIFKKPELTFGVTINLR